MEYFHIDSIDEIGAYVECYLNPIPFIVTADSDRGFCGIIFKNYFGYKQGDKTNNLEQILKNFYAYEKANDRNPLIFILGNANIENSRILKRTNNWVVHSTDNRAIKSIIENRYLLSRSELKKRGITYLDFGRSILGEPNDYYDLIEFVDVDTLAPEIIVASKSNNRFCNSDVEYIPGGRIYIDLKTLTKQEGFIDFLDHYCIKGELELLKTLYCIIIPDNIETKKWTPKLFTQEANKRFVEVENSIRASPSGRSARIVRV